MPYKECSKYAGLYLMYDSKSFGECPICSAVEVINKQDDLVNKILNFGLLALSRTPDNDKEANSLKLEKEKTISMIKKNINATGKIIRSSGLGSLVFKDKPKRWD